MKLRKKLIMSGVALAACAATLTSTTYAWYVSNANATVSNITGNTAAASATGNLFVAHSTAQGAVDGEYSPAIDFADGGHKTTTQLTPANLDTTGKWTDKFAADISSSNPYFEYKFFLWSTKEATVNVDFTVTNTTATLPTQTVYSNVGTGVAAGGDLTVDAIYALRMSVDIDGVINYYDVASAAGYTANTPAAALNAHDYYAQVAGSMPAGCVTTETLDIKTTMDTWTVVPSETEGQLVTIRVWLEGADIHCFDACAGQSFDFDLAFSIADGE